MNSRRFQPKAKPILQTPILGFVRDGWTVAYCNDLSRVIYINIYTKKTQWYKPATVGFNYYPTAIKCSHILIKYEMCIGRVSCNYVLRSKKDACNLINRCYALINTMQYSFEKIARYYSDCPSARYGGNIGYSNIHTASRAFIELAFILEVGEMTLPVATEEGYEIFLRTA